MRATYVTVDRCYQLIAGPHGRIYLVPFARRGLDGREEWVQARGYREERARPRVVFHRDTYTGRTYKFLAYGRWYKLHSRFVLFPLTQTRPCYVNREFERYLAGQTGPAGEFGRERGRHRYRLALIHVVQRERYRERQDRWACGAAAPFPHLTHAQEQCSVGSAALGHCDALASVEL